MSRGLKSAGLPIPATYHKLSLKLCYTFGLFQVSWSQLLSLIYSSKSVFSCHGRRTYCTEDLPWWFILLLQGCEGDRISFIQKLPKKKLPLLLVNVSRCSLSFSSLSNKDLESHWWSFWRVLWVSDHDTSEDHTSMTLSANAEGFFKKVPGNLLRSVHLQSYITYCFSKQLYWLIQCYMSIIYLNFKQKNPALLRYNSHDTCKEYI